MGHLLHGRGGHGGVAVSEADAVDGVAHVELGRVLGAELVDVRAVPHDALALSHVEVAGDFIDLRQHRQREKKMRK